jgi:hypothetical protein
LLCDEADYRRHVEYIHYAMFDFFDEA